MVIERRGFIKGVGGLAVSASLSPLSFGQDEAEAIGIVGGGIVGASIAMNLAQAGAKVILFEKTAPASGATSKSFAWINAFTDDAHYRALRIKGIRGYMALDVELGLKVSWGGAIKWVTSLAEAQKMEASARVLSRSGYESRIVDAGDISQLEPNLNLGIFESAVYCPLDGHIDPVHVTYKMLEAAISKGANIVHPCEVTELRINNERLEGVATTTGDYRLSKLVIAGGTDTPALAAQAGYTPPLVHAPGVLLHTQPTNKALGRLVESPMMHVKQFQDGRIVASHGGYRLPDISAHQGISEGPQEMPEEIQVLHGDRILARTKEYLSGIDDAEYDRVTLGYRPMPKDAKPIVGYSPKNPDVYIAVMHSGVTLAPIMGQYIAHELLQNELIDELAPYRPNRFS
jgi:glycine/D-amino acid oxidase-like deaminating enzyme